MPLGNPYERARRLEKARALARTIRECGGDANGARQMSACDWGLAARAAKVNTPSEATKAEAVSILELAVQVSERSMA